MKRRLDLVDRAVVRLEVDVSELGRERGLELRIEEAPGREAAADEVLPHAALRLVEAHRRHGRERRALVGRVDARLVEPVAELVDRCEEADREVGLVVARRQPDVLRARAHRERVHRRIEPPALVVEAHPLEHLERERALLLDREVAPAQRRVVHAVGVLADLRDQRHELPLELVEDRAHLVGGQALVEVVEEDVVVGLEAHAFEAVDVAVRELDVLLQVGQEDREVRLLARLDPGRQRVRAGPGHLGAQLARAPASPSRSRAARRGSGSPRRSRSPRSPRSRAGRPADVRSRRR